MPNTGARMNLSLGQERGRSTCRIATAARCGAKLDVSRGVQFGVFLGGELGVIGGMKAVGMRHVSVVSGLFVVARSVVPCGLSVVVCGLGVMVGCLGMMMGCFLRHSVSSRAGRREFETPSAPENHRLPEAPSGLHRFQLHMNMQHFSCRQQDPRFAHLNSHRT